MQQMTGKRETRSAKGLPLQNLNKHLDSQTSPDPQGTDLLSCDRVFAGCIGTAMYGHLILARKRVSSHAVEVEVRGN